MPMQVPITSSLRLTMSEVLINQTVQDPHFRASSRREEAVPLSPRILSLRMLADVFKANFKKRILR
jgi:hypothetical protein